MEKILITGSKGRVGRTLSKALSKKYQLTLADLPKIDVCDYSQLLKLASGKDAIIHLAWNAKTENFQGGYNPINSLMFYNVYRVALEAKIPRVIMASSVHADDFRNYSQKKLMSPNRTPSPTSPYGADKVFMESLGRFYAKKGLEVVCVRFGAVGYGKPKDREGKILWLTNTDAVSLFESVLNAKKIPNNFCIVYGVSNNKNKIHDLSNPFGWKPKEGFNLFTQ